jgi:glycosyltransferase involved in cell wall biosynthesis
MTRFLNVNVFLDPRAGGGTAERTFQLSKALAHAGTDTTVLCLDIGLDAARIAALGGVPVMALPCVNRRFLVPRVASDALERAVAAADVVQLTNHWTVLNAMVYRVARRQRKPWIVCPAGALAIFGRSAALKRAYNAAVGRHIVRDAAAAVAITAAENEQFAAYGVKPERIFVVPNGVDVEAYARHDVPAFRRSCGVGEAPFVLFVGRLNRIKGPDLLLDAFARMRAENSRYHLVYAGPDEGLQAELEERAQALGLASRVHFTGYLDADRKASAYHAADLVAVPSRQEAMSIVALEAGACAKPVLLTDQCGFPDVASEGGGLIVEAEPHAIAAGLDTILADRQQREIMGRRLFDMVRARYTWAAAAHRYHQIFDAVSRPSGCAS